LRWYKRKTTPFVPYFEHDVLVVNQMSSETSNFFKGKSFVSALNLQIIERKIVFETQIHIALPSKHHGTIPFWRGSTRIAPRRREAVSAAHFLYYEGSEPILRCWSLTAEHNRGGFKLELQLSLKSRNLSLAVLAQKGVGKGHEIRYYHFVHACQVYILPSSFNCNKLL